MTREPFALKLLRLGYVRLQPLTTMKCMGMTSVTEEVTEEGHRRGHERSRSLHVPT